MISLLTRLGFGLGWAVLTTTASAELAVTRVTEQVYSAIGATQPPTYENRGHNNNLSFIITDEGVVVINGGDNYRLARDLHAEIRKLSNVPVRYVINENGQGHAFLGNSYWVEQGATIIAHALAVEKIRRHGEGSLQRMLERNRELGEGTSVVIPDRIVEGELAVITLGGTRIEIRRFGPAHSPGDVSVWLPDQGVLIAGDIAFHQRLLGIFPDTDVAGWIGSFDRMATLGARYVVPGHGAPTDMVTITRYTRDYLQFLTEEVQKILDRDGDLADAYAIDQSAYSHLDTFEELAGKNAGRLFQTLEMQLF